MNKRSCPFWTGANDCSAYPMKVPCKRGSVTCTAIQRAYRLGHTDEKKNLRTTVGDYGYRNTRMKNIVVRFYRLRNVGEAYPMLTRSSKMFYKRFNTIEDLVKFTVAAQYKVTFVDLQQDLSEPQYKVFLNKLRHYDSYK